MLIGILRSNFAIPEIGKLLKKERKVEDFHLGPRFVFLH
jgi:hypothetical protein